MQRAIPFLYILAEFLAFYLVGKWIGFGWALIVLAGLFSFGTLFALYEMRSITRRALADPTARPGAVVGDYGLLLAGLAGVALPGYITSILGVLCILPPTRAVIRGILAKRTRARLDEITTGIFVRRQSTTSYGSFAPIIDEEDIASWSHEVQPEDFKNKRRPSDPDNPTGANDTP